MFIHSFMVYSYIHSYILSFTHSFLHLQLKAPSVKHQSAALTYHDGRLVVLGGGCADIEVYDSEHDTWSLQPYSLPHAMQFHAAVTMLLPE